MLRVLIIVNPRSGHTGSDISELVHQLSRRGAAVTTRYLTSDSSLSAVLAGAGRFDRVVAVGGDGTVSSVAYALRGSGLPVVICPGGTANLVAMNLGMPASPQALAEIAVDGPTADFDLGELTFAETCDDACGLPKAGFLMAAGAGFDAAIMESAQALKPALGAGAYVLAAFQNLAPTVARFRLVLDGVEVDTEGIAVLLCNFARVQFDLAVTHTSDAQDGRLEVVVMRTKSAVGLLPAIWAALLDRIVDHPDRSPSFQIHEARTIQVHADPPLTVQYDGEVVTHKTPLCARVLPGVASLALPPDSPLLLPRRSA